MLTNIEHWSSAKSNIGVSMFTKIVLWSLNATAENRRGPQKIEARRRARSLLLGHALQFGNLKPDVIHVAWNALSM